MEIYCRKLGHYLLFSYCCREQGQLPCRQLLDCWQKYGLRPEHLAHLRQHDVQPAPPAKLSLLIQLASDTKSSIA